MPVYRSEDEGTSISGVPGWVPLLATHEVESSSVVGGHEDVRQYASPLGKSLRYCHVVVVRTHTLDTNRSFATGPELAEATTPEVFSPRAITKIVSIPHLDHHSFKRQPCIRNCRRNWQGRLTANRSGESESGRIPFRNYLSKRYVYTTSPVGPAWGLTNPSSDLNPRNPYLDS